MQCGRPGFGLWVRKIPWRRKWQPTPVFLPGKSLGFFLLGRRSLADYSPCGRKESDTTEQPHMALHNLVPDRVYTLCLLFAIFTYASFLPPKLFNTCNSLKTSKPARVLDLYLCFALCLECLTFPLCQLLQMQEHPSSFITSDVLSVTCPIFPEACVLPLSTVLPLCLA